VKSTNVQPIRVVEQNGEVITLDNRRLAAFQAAGKKIRVERVSLNKGAAKATLRAHGKIE